MVCSLLSITISSIELCPADFLQVSSYVYICVVFSPPTSFFSSNAE